MAQKRVSSVDRLASAIAAVLAVSNPEAAKALNALGGPSESGSLAKGETPTATWEVTRYGANISVKVQPVKEDGSPDGRFVRHFLPTWQTILPAAVAAMQEIEAKKIR